MTKEASLRNGMLRDFLAVCGVAMTGLAVSLGFAMVPAASANLAALFGQIAG